MTGHGGRREGAGRKKGYAAVEAEKAREYIARRVQEKHGPIVGKAIEQAMSGDKSARDWLYDRAYGRPRQNVGLDGGEEGEPITVFSYEQAATIARRTLADSPEGEEAPDRLPDSEQSEVRG